METNDPNIKEIESHEEAIENLLQYLSKDDLEIQPEVVASTRESYEKGNTEAVQEFLKDNKLPARHVEEKDLNFKLYGELRGSVVEAYSSDENIYAFEESKENKVLNKALQAYRDGNEDAIEKAQPELLELELNKQSTSEKVVYGHVNRMTKGLVNVNGVELTKSLVSQAPQNFNGEKFATSLEFLKKGNYKGQKISFQEMHKLKTSNSESITKSISKCSQKTKVNAPKMGQKI